MKSSDSTVSGSSLDLEISILTKVQAPGVLDQPEVLSSLISIANHSDLMVEVVLAVGVSGLVAAPAVVIDTVAVISQVRSLEYENYKS